MKRDNSCKEMIGKGFHYFNCVFVYVFNFFLVSKSQIQLESVLV